MDHGTGNQLFRPLTVSLVVMIAGLFVSLIPIFGWFVGPTYSVVAGIVFGIFVVEEESDAK